MSGSASGSRRPTPPNTTVCAALERDAIGIGERARAVGGGDVLHRPQGGVGLRARTREQHDGERYASTGTGSTTGTSRKMPRRRPATTVPSTSARSSAAASVERSSGRHVALERRDGREVQQRVDDDRRQQRARAQHRVAEHHAERDERQRVERVADLRHVAREHGEHQTRRDDRGQTGTDTPVLGVAPVATAELRHRRTDQDEHREPVHDLLVERGEDEAHRFGEPADVARVLDDAEEQRGGAHREELVPRREVRAVEAEASPPDHHDEDDLDRERRRDRHEAEVAEVDVAPRGDHVEHDRERGHRHDRPGERPPCPAEPLPDERHPRRACSSLRDLPPHVGV